MPDREKVIRNLETVYQWVTVDVNFSNGLTGNDYEKIAGWVSDGIAMLKEQNGLTLALEQSNAVNGYLNAEVERLNGLLKEQEHEVCENCPYKLEDIGDFSDGYHTFNDLYYQRCVLFATIVNMNKSKAWKTRYHEDGEPCFGGGWFLVTVETPEGPYGYHYEDKYWDMFDCKELEIAKPWDGYTKKDVHRLFSLEKHGEWQTIWDKNDPDTSSEARCSVCGRVSERPLGHYCKWCGSTMDKEC